MLPFIGKPWNKEAQRKFVILLEQAEFFQGQGSKTPGDLSARERIGRAPKTFGFLRGESHQPLEFPPAGIQLIEKRDLPDLFLPWHVQIRTLAHTWLDEQDSAGVASDLTERYEAQRSLLREIEAQIWQRATS